MLNQILPAAGELHLLTLNQIYLLWVSSGKRHQRTGPTALFILCLFIFLAASNLDIIQHSSIHPTTHLSTRVQLVPLTAPGGLKVQAFAATTAFITLFSVTRNQFISPSAYQFTHTPLSIHARMTPTSECQWWTPGTGVCRQPPQRPSRSAPSTRPGPACPGCPAGLPTCQTRSSSRRTPPPQRRLKCSSSPAVGRWWGRLLVFGGQMTASPAGEERVS